MFTHQKQFIGTGESAGQAERAVILIHGRGSSAKGILSLQQHLAIEDALLLAPQATNNTWYPYSFMAPVNQNQPALNSALTLVDDVVQEALGSGIPAENIYFAGFSQGACLTLEYTARHAKRYGGVVAFTGGLIGEVLDTSAFRGDFAGTPILITSGDNDPHVPASRIEESREILTALGAEVTVEIYHGKPHSISADETHLANTLIFK